MFIIIFIYYLLLIVFFSYCQSTITVKSWWWRRWCMVWGVLGVDSQGIRKMAVEVVLMSILLTLGVFHTLLWCLCSWIWTVNASWVSNIFVDYYISVCLFNEKYKSWKWKKSLNFYTSEVLYNLIKELQTLEAGFCMWWTQACDNCKHRWFSTSFQACDCAYI